MVANDNARLMQHFVFAENVNRAERDPDADPAPEFSDMPQLRTVLARPYGRQEYHRERAQHGNRQESDQKPNIKNEAERYQQIAHVGRFHFRI